jgi:pre-mRNA-splicing factor ATP-dependent RNA helicase DHX15/PRP43
MADRRPDIQGESRAKRMKASPSEEMDPRANPYLAHIYGGLTYGQGANGYNNGGDGYASQKPNSIAGFQRHQTTAAMAKEAEDGPLNPFTGEQLSQTYFNILKTRRGLPVHAQRYVLFS